MSSMPQNVLKNRWKLRCGPAGLHAFNRVSGLNVLFDEIQVPASLYSRAPRHVSIALTNRCDLACAHCYAPKSRDQLHYDLIANWLTELDANGTLGVGFGGGEPTLHREFVRLCEHAAQETQLSVTFTTHGHHIDETMADELRGNVHFIRVSMDGVGNTYAAIRGRPFHNLLERMKLIRTITNFGVNFVVNERTLPNLDEAVAVAADLGGSELLLLPQMETRSCPRVDAGTLEALRRWVEAYRGRMKLCITEGSAEGFPTCDPFASEQGLRSYAHVDATGVLKASSYHRSGMPIGGDGVLSALDRLSQEIAES